MADNPSSAGGVTADKDSPTQQNDADKPQESGRSIEKHPEQDSKGGTEEEAKGSDAPANAEAEGPVKRSPRLSHVSQSTPRSQRSQGSASSRKTLPWSGGPGQLQPPPGVRTTETVPKRIGPKSLKHVPSAGVIIRSGSTT